MKERDDMKPNYGERDDMSGTHLREKIINTIRDSMESDELCKAHIDWSPELIADKILALFQKLVDSCKDKDEIVKLLNRIDNDQ